VPESTHITNYNKLVLTIASMCNEVFEKDGKDCYIDSLNAERTAKGIEVVMIITFFGDHEEIVDIVNRAAAASNSEVAYIGRLFSHRYIVHAISKRSK